MVDQLFGSKTRVKLLGLFYTNPNRSFYVREITRKIDEQINSVRRELANLLSIGIIVSDTSHNKLYYEVNQSYEYYRPLAVIFGNETMETVTAPPEPAKGKKAAKDKGKVSQKQVDETPVVAKAPDHPMSKSLRGIGKVELALLTGQFTRDERSGVDLLLVGDINQTQATRYVEDMEKAEGKEIRYVIMTASEYAYRLQVKDRFLSNILTAKKQVIINEQTLQVEN